MSQVFQCPECGANVVYNGPEPIPGTYGLEVNLSRAPMDVVYLLCPNGHWHPYTVPKGEG